MMHFMCKYIIIRVEFHPFPSENSKGTETCIFICFCSKEIRELQDQQATRQPHHRLRGTKRVQRQGTDDAALRPGHPAGVCLRGQHLAAERVLSARLLTGNHT